MTGRDILVALSEIDDELIEQADVRRGAGAEAAGARGDEKVRPVGSQKGSGDEKTQPIGIRSGWRRYTGAVIGVAAACILLLAAIPVIRNARVTTNTEKSGGNVSESFSVSGTEAQGSERTESDGKVFLGQAATAYLDAEVAEEEGEADAVGTEDLEQDADIDVSETDGTERDADIGVNEADDTEQDADEAGAESTGSALIANPFTEYASLAEAEEAVGFTLAAPASFEGAEMTIIRGMGSELLEVIYTDDSGEERFRLRKSVGSEDVSGDDSEYSSVESLTLGESVVEIKGNEKDSVSLATWECDGCSYALEAQLYPMTTEEFKAFKAQMGS